MIAALDPRSRRRPAGAGHVLRGARRRRSAGARVPAPARRGAVLTHADAHDQIGAWWDDDAPVYDDAPGHAIVRSGGGGMLASGPGVDASARPRSRVLDAGTGTGSLAFLAAELGHDVIGVDLSEGMLERARGRPPRPGPRREFVHGPRRGTAGRPVRRGRRASRPVDRCPIPAGALRAWRSVCRPGGRLVLLEGSWGGEGPFVARTDALDSGPRSG